MNGTRRSDLSVVEVDRLRVLLWNRERDAGTLYQPVEVPEFDGWEVAQPCRERFDMMLAHLGGRTGTVLDVGCHTGWFCRAFARLGWSAFGVDRSAEWIEAARILNRIFATDPPPSYFVADAIRRDLPSADVLLLLSTSMYMFDDGVEAGWRALRRFSGLAPIMFYDAGGMYEGRVPFRQEEAGDAICAGTRYVRHATLGTSAIGRRLMVFER